MATVKRIIAGIALLAAGTALGYFACYHYQVPWVLALQRQEVVGRAKLDVITLSELRTGGVEQARLDLEQHLDAAISTVYLSDKRSPGGPGSDAIKLFQLAKVYHASFPPSPSSPAAVKEALDSVPMSSLTFCSPALRKVMAELPNSPGATKPTD